MYSSHARSSRSPSVSLSLTSTPLLSKRQSSSSLRRNHSQASLSPSSSSARSSATSSRSPNSSSARTIAKPLRSSASSSVLSSRSDSLSTGSTNNDGQRKEPTPQQVRFGNCARMGYRPSTPKDRRICCSRHLSRKYKTHCKGIKEYCKRDKPKKDKPKKDKQKKVKQKNDNQNKKDVTGPFARLASTCTQSTGNVRSLSHLYRQTLELYRTALQADLDSGKCKAHELRKLEQDLDDTTIKLKAIPLA